MANRLKEYFPMIREKEDLLAEIQANPTLKRTYDKLRSELKQEFLDFCTGMKGIKILRDSFFKETVNPEYDPKRLEDLLSVMLGRNVRIVRILPNDSTRIADETSLLITDVIVELEDGSLANVEIQKIGYAFPGPRSACYSADMLLRQYKRVRAQKGKKFVYSQIKNVFLIVIYETSPKEFKKCPDYFYHHSKQVFESGLELDLLQEYVMIPLDIYHKRMDNEPIRNKLEAWLAFLADDRPERIIELITKYPEFKPMYKTLYQMCLNAERVIDMFFSEELRMLDRNTVQYMIDEQQKELEEKKKELKEKMKELEEQNEELIDQEKKIKEQNEELIDQEKKIKEQNEELIDQEKKIKEQNKELIDQEKKIKEQNEELIDQKKIIVQQEQINLQQAEEITRLKLELEHLKNSK